MFLKHKTHYPSFIAHISDIVPFILRRKKISKSHTIAILLGGIFIAFLGGIIFRNQISTFFSNPGADPVAYWKFDEGNGGGVIDATGNEHNLTINAALRRTSEFCIHGNCLEFDGNGDYVSNGNSGSETFTSTDTWTSPADITEVTVQAIGGGGGGGRARGNPATGGGGSGGSYAEKIVTVEPEEEYTVNVGIGGSASSGTSGAVQHGGTGQPSWFGSTNTVYAQGGAGGLSDGNVNSSNGVGATGSSALSIGDTIYRGGNGSTGVYTSSTGYSGAGGGGAGTTGAGGDANQGIGGTGISLYGGKGANGVGNNSVGATGLTYGGGGSGGKANTTTDRDGAAGANGLVILSWGDDPEYFGSDTFTIAGWFRRSTASQTSYIVSQFGDAGFKVYMNADGTVSCGIDDDSSWGPDAVVSSTEDYDDSVWHLFHCIKNGTSSLTLYIDSVQAGQNTSISGISTLVNTAAFYIGIDSDGSSNGWQGYLDEIKYYDYARSASQIKTEYAARGTTKGISASFGANDMAMRLTNGLVGYWKMDAGTGASVADFSGNNNTGTLGNGNSAPTWVAGKLGGGLDFDGTDDYISIPDSPSLVFGNGTSSNPFSFSVWIKANSFASFNGLVAKGFTQEWYIFLENGKLSFTIVDDSTNGYIFERYHNTTLQTDTWYHVVASYDGLSGGQGMNMYLNGQNMQSTQVFDVGTFVAIEDTNSTFTIGFAEGYDFAGLIDEVRIYNRALSQDEITALYNYVDGPVGHFKLDDKVSGGEQPLANASAHYLSAVTNAGVNGMNCLIQGKFGGACHFDGVDDYITVDSFNPLASEVEPTEYSLWSVSDVPNDFEFDGNVNLGVKFQSSEAGTVTGIKFYKHSSNTGTHIGNLWDTSGNKLAEATFTDETSSGWQTVALSTPVDIEANTTYVVSYHTTVGYSNNSGYFSSSHTNSPLTALSNGSSGGNGVYAYSGSPTFPSNTFGSTNYWVDVVFIETTSEENTDFNADSEAFSIGGWIKKPEMSLGGAGGDSTVLNYTGFEGGALPSSGSRGAIDLYDITDGTLNYIEVQSDNKRTGEYALGTIDSCDLNDDEYVGIAQPDGNSFTRDNVTTWVTFYLYPETSHSSDIEIFQINRDNFNAGPVYLRWEESSNNFYLMNADFQSSSTTTITPDEWHKIEIEYDELGGEATLYVDGEERVSIAPASTNTTTVFNEVWFKEGECGGGIYYIDDLVISTDRITYDPRIVRMDVDGDGNSTDWDASNGYQEVDDVPDDGDTTFITSSTSNNKQLVSLESAISAGVDANVKAIKTQALVRDTGGSSNLATVVRISETDYDQGEDRDPGSNYNSIGSVLATNPNTLAAWTREDLDSLQVGVLNNASAATRATSLSTMVLMDDGVVDRYVFSRYKNSQGYKMWFDENGAINFGIDDDSSWTPDDIVTSTNTFDDNIWHHVYAVKDATNAIRLYVDGQLVDSDISIAATGSVKSGLADLVFGTDQPTFGGYFDGMLDDIRIYNYARTTSEIVSDMNAGHPAVGTPVGSTVLHLKMDEGYGTTVLDWSPQGNNGIFGTGTSAPTWTSNGKFGRALSFDGTGDLVNVGDPANESLDFGTGDFSVSIWAKTTYTAGQTLIAKSDHGSNTGWSIDMDNTSAGTIRFILVDDTSKGVTGVGDINDGNWHHIVGVRSSGTMYLYQNGKLLGTDAGNTDNVSSSTPLTLGRRTGSTPQSFVGTLDEVKIYPFALTADQVKIDMNQAKAQVMGAGSTGVGGTSPSDSASREYCVPGDTATCSAPVGEWKFDEGVGGTAHDTSGNGNHCNLSSMPDQSWVVGKYGLSLNFQKTDDVLNCGSGTTLDTLSALTVSAWIKPRPSSSYEQIVAKASSATPNNGWLFESNMANNTLEFWVDTSSGNDLIRISSNNVLSDNIWQHVAVTWNGSLTATNIKMYVNGSEVSYATTTNGGGSRTSDNSANLTIGNDINTVDDYDGQIDEVRVYNYVRTPAQIAWEYNRGAPVAYYKMNECSGTTINDWGPDGNGGYNGNNGTLNLGASGVTSAGDCDTNANTAWYNGSGGKVGGSISLDSNDDYISISDASELRPGNGSWSISFWGKFPNSNQQGSIIAKSQSSGDFEEYHISIGNDIDLSNGGQRMGFSFRQSGSNERRVISTADVVDNTWHYYTWIADKDANSIKFYVDGISHAVSGNNTGSWPTIDNTDSLVFGRHYAGSGTHKITGQLDEVKIFNYALTPARIKTEMAGGAVRFE